MQSAKSGQRGHGRQTFWAPALCALALAACGSPTEQNGVVGDGVAVDVLVDALPDTAQLDVGGCSSDQDCDHSGDTLCLATRCDAASRACITRPQNNTAACEDGDPCTIGDACKDGACVAGPGNACACKADADCEDDGDPCTGEATCDKSTWPWSCATTPAPTCDADLGPCQIGACDSKTGGCVAESAPDGTSCDDGDACTVGDACAAGQCAAGSTNVCTCSTDADCKDDGDLCNGAPYCDKSDPGKPVCKPNPGTVVSCPADAGKPCQAFQCQPTTGLCVLVATDQGKACDDGDACSKGEVCQGGLCGGGADICTCSKDADCAGKDDGDLCNGTPFCNLQTGSCETNPKTKVVCPTVGDTACSKNACIPATGACSPLPTEKAELVCDLGDADTCRWAAKPVGAPKGATPACDDGDPCTASDGCQGGACTGGTFVCSCNSDADCAGQDDGNLCNGVPYCDKNDPQGPTCKPNPASVVTCPSVDDTDCLVAQCQPKSGLCAPAPQPVGTPCEDGNACTKSDFCSGGQCLAGVQTCACQSNADCLGEDDGDLCNGVPYCDKSDPAKPVCKENPASAVFCPPAAQACVTSACDPKTGSCQLGPAKAGTACDDGDACTSGDVCQGGLCSGKDKGCDDGNLCTIDSCDAKGNCVHVAGNCDDGNACTVDTCDGKTGDCAFATAALQGKPCFGDDDGCTVAQSCDAGACKGGKTVACVLPTGACEAAQCVSTGAQSFQCVVLGAPDGAPCDDGDPCSLGDSCAGGSCSAGSGTPLYAQVLPDLATPTALHDAAPLSGGAYAVAGQFGTASAGYGWVISRRNRSGEVAWTRTVADAPLDAESRPAGVWGGKGDAVIVAGAWGKGVSRKARVLRLSADGKLITADHVVGKAGSEERVHAARDDDEGGAWLAGARSTSGASTGRLLHVNADGLLVGDFAVGAGPVDVAAAYDRAIDGAHLLGTVRHTPSSTSNECRLVVLEAAGSTRLITPALPLHNLRAVAAAGSDTFAVGDTFGTAGKQAVLRLDAKGKARWSRQLQVGSLMAAVAVPGVGLAVAGYDGSWDSPTAKVVALGGLGSLAWQRAIGSPSGGALLALRTDAAGSLLAVGMRRSGTGAQATTQALAVRLSAFGHIDCGAAGVCLDKSAGACSDGNPCTDGLCGAKAGCVQLSHTMACDDGDACSKGESCADGSCGGAIPVTCPDAAICTTVACEKGKGCVTKLDPAGTSCDDAEPCTEADACDGKGGCKGKAASCDDGLLCTDDACLPGKGCSYVAKDAACDDGEPCTVDTCTPGASTADAKGCTLAPIEVVKGSAVACDDGVACTVGATCKGGSCAAGQPGKLWELDAGETTGVGTLKGFDIHAEAVVAWGDGGAAVAATLQTVHGAYSRFGFAGPTFSNGKPAATAARARVVRVGPTGQELWDRTIGDAQKQGGDEAVRALVRDKAGVVAFGYGSTASKGGDDGFAEALDAADGGRRWIFRYGSAADERLFAATATPEGFLAVGTGDSAATKGWDAWLLRVSPLGFQTESVMVNGGANERANAVLRYVDKDGSERIALAGTRSGDDDDAWLAVVDGKGALLWQRVSAVVGLHDFATALHRDAAGSFYVVGAAFSTVEAEPSLAPLLWSLDAAGAARWRIVEETDAWSSTRHVVPIGASGLTADGSELLLHGTRSSKGGRHLRRRRAQDGIATFAAAQPSNGFALGSMQPEAGVVTPDDGLLSAGHRTGVFSHQLHLARSDAWGAVACSASGSCADKKAAQCDDGSACSLRDCAAGTCAFSPHVGRPCQGEAFCAGAMACDAGGKCSKTADRLWQKVENLDEGSTVSKRTEYRASVAATSDGGFVQVGGVQYVKDPKCYSVYCLGVYDAVIRRYDAAGTLRWQDRLEHTGYAGEYLQWIYRDVAVGGDGTVVATGYRNDHPLYGQAYQSDKRYGIFAVYSPWGDRRAAYLDRIRPGGFQGGLDTRALYGVAAAGDGLFVAAGYDGVVSAGTGDARYVWLYAMQVDASIVQAYNIKSSKKGIAYDVAVTTVGEAAVVVANASVGYYDAKTGKDLGWVQPPTTTGKVLTNLVARPEGGVVAVGYVKASGLLSGQASYLSAWDKDRKLLWEATPDIAGADAATGVAALGAGRVVAVGNGWVDGQGQQLRAVFLGADGSTLAEAMVGTAATDSPGAGGVATLASGAVVVGGIAGTGTAADGFAATISAFGPSSCVTAGFCADLSQAACDDGDACTADACAPAKGCTHAAVPG
ncbi:MAG: hypothetical protein H6747_11120, partial [Deltaproteobacteria bacterium]|nr:hypothetical protein [Deltaproteobacteria bacterium]